MTSWSNRMNGGGPYYIGMEVTHTRTGNTVRVTCTIRWRRDAYGITSWNEVDASASARVADVINSGGLRFNAPAGGAIGWTLSSATYKDYNHPPGSGALSIAVSGSINTRTQDGGAGSISATYTVPANGYPAPGTPGTPTIVSEDGGGWDAKWSPASGTVNGYNCRYRIDGGAWVNFNAGGTTAYASNAAWGGRKVELQVQAKNATQAGAWSGIGSTIMKATKPGRPAAPILSSPEAGALNATWAAPSATGGKPITGYVYQISGNGGTTWATKADANVLSQALTGLTPGGVYQARVQAKNVDAASTYSAVATLALTAESPGQPPEPRLSSPSAGMLTVACTAPAYTGGKPISTWTIRYRHEDAADWSTTTSTSATTTIGPLIPGGRYTVEVIASNPDASSEPSATAVAQLMASAPSVPILWSVTSPLPGQIAAAWLPPVSTGGKPVTYDVRYALNDSMTASPKTTAAADPTVTITGAPRGVDVWVQVRAKNLDATGSWTEPVRVTILSGVYVDLDGTGYKPAYRVRGNTGTGYVLAAPRARSGATWESI